MGRSGRRFHICIVIAISLGACSAARAQTMSWNTGSGSWTNLANWSPNNVPDLSSEAALFASSTGDNTPNADDADATLDSPITIGTLTMSAAQPHLTIQATGALTVSNTTLSSGAAQVIVQNGGQFTSTSFDTIGIMTVNAGGQFNATHYVQHSIGESTVSGTLDASSGSIQLNQGTLAATNNGVIRASTLSVGSLSQLVVRNGGQAITNSLDNSGEIRLDGGRVSSGTIQVNSGYVSGSGTISSVQFNDFSTLNPGTRDNQNVPSPGQIHVAGSLDIESSDTYHQVDITSTGYDQVMVEAAATLHGTLFVQIAGSFVPSNSAEYVILTAQSIDRAGMVYEHSLGDPGRILVSNDDGMEGSFELFDRFNEPTGEYQLVLAHYSAAPEPSALLLSLTLLPLMTRPRRS